MTERGDYKCEVCGYEVKNALLPVRHVCVSRGVGDTIAKVTKAFGVKPCGKCKKRQSALNEMFPYKEKDNGK